MAEVNLTRAKEEISEHSPGGEKGQDSGRISQEILEATIWNTSRNKEGISFCCEREETKSKLCPRHQRDVYPPDLHIICSERRRAASTALKLSASRSDRAGPVSHCHTYDDGNGAPAVGRGESTLTINRHKANDTSILINQAARCRRIWVHQDYSIAGFHRSLLRLQPPQPSSGSGDGQPLFLRDNSFTGLCAG